MTYSSQEENKRRKSPGGEDEVSFGDRNFGIIVMATDTFTLLPELLTPYFKSTDELVEAQIYFPARSFALLRSHTR